MFCPECGKKIADDSKFCMECGFKIENQTDSNDKISANEFLAKRKATNNVTNNNNNTPEKKNNKNATNNNSNTPEKKNNKNATNNNNNTPEKKNNKNAIIIGIIALGIIIVGVIGLQMYGEYTISDHVKVFDCHDSINSEFEYGAFSNQYYVAPLDVYSGAYGYKYEGYIIAKARFDKSYENVQFYVEYLSEDGESLSKEKATLHETYNDFPETKSVEEDGRYRVEAPYYGSEMPDKVRFYVNSRNDDKVNENEDYVCELTL